MAVSDITGTDLDPTNVLLTVPALFVALALAFFGFQSDNLGLLVAGLTLFLLPASGLIISDNNLFNSENFFYYSALAYIAGNLVFLLPSILGELSVSLSATPSQSYLAAALGQTSEPVTAIMNNYLAPRGENMSILGAGILLLITAREVTENKVAQAGIALVPTSIAFALLHGVRSPFFLLIAGMFMTAWGIIYLGDDLGIEFLDEISIAGFALTVGLHQGNNISASGGLFEYYSVILSASPPVYYLSLLIVAIDLVLVGYVVYKTGFILRESGVGGLLYEK